jgi:hypothetical protein
MSLLLADFERVHQKARFAALLGLLICVNGRDWSGQPGTEKSIEGSRRLAIHRRAPISRLGLNISSLYNCLWMPKTKDATRNS